MDWNEVMIAGVIGTVVGGILSVLCKQGRIGRTPAIIIFLVLIIGGNILHGGVIKPHLTEDNEAQEVDDALAQLPVYSTIRTQEPALYDQIRSNMLRLAKEGKTQQEIIDSGKLTVSNLAAQRMSHAPDANVIAAAQLGLDEMTALLARNDDTCFKFLFPQISGGINLPQLVPPELVQRDLNNLNNLLLATGKDQNVRPTPISDEKFQALMTPIREALQKRYGDQLLEDPSSGKADRTKICEMSISLYSNILALPAEQSAPLLRTVLGKQG